eukprot:g22946.t1
MFEITAKFKNTDPYDNLQFYTSEKINSASFNALTKLCDRLKEKYPHNKHQPATLTTYGLIYIKTAPLSGFKPLQDVVYKFTIETHEGTKKNGETFIILKLAGAPAIALNECLNSLITTQTTPQETLQNISQLHNYLNATHPDTYAQLIKIKDNLKQLPSTEKYKSTKSKKKVSPEEPEWLRSYTVKANVDKLAKAASDKPARRCTTPRSEELATTGFSSTVLDSSTPRQSNPTTEISVAEVATPLEKYKSSGRFFEPLREGSMENRRDSDDVNEEGKGGGNHEGKEAEKGEGLEEVENDEEDDDFEPFKLLESEWKRFACRLDQDNVATIQILFRADHTVSFGARVEFQGVPRNPLPHTYVAR